MPSGRVPPSGLGISTRRDGSARYAPECTRPCRSSRRSSNRCSYSLHTNPSTPADAVFFRSRKAQRSASVVMWCKSAVSFSCGFLVAACRIRSTAWDTLSRHCVRHVLWSCGFPLVEALPSSRSAGAFVPLFAALTGTPASSDFFIPCIIGYGVPPSPLRPRFDFRGRMKTSQVPAKDVRTCMGSLTPWSPSSPHPSR